MDVLNLIMVRTSVAAYCVIALSAFSTTAVAQENPAQSAPDTQGDEAGLRDIIVTAQRRDESLSRTPVAVSILSADTLSKAQIVSEQDLRVATPGLAVRASLSSNQLNYSLRGQSQDAYSGTHPGVQPYINEVQVSGSSGSSAFYDLQSVQVLKGPQGTLFGRSATGGAVLFTTAKPADEFGGYASATVGNYGALKFEGALNVPIAGDRLMARVAGFYQERKGFQRNLFDGGREGDIERTGVRGSLTAQISDGIRNELVVDYLNTDSENTQAVLSGLLPFVGGGPGNPPFIPIEFLYAGTATPGAVQTGIRTAGVFVGAINPATGAVINPTLLGQVSAFYTNYFANPRHPAGGIRGVLDAQRARGPFVVDTDGSNFYQFDNVVVTNVTSFEIGDNATLKNIFGYVHSKGRLGSEADGSPYAISTNGVKGAPGATQQRARSISNELQIQGKAFDERLDYVVGLYFSDERSTNLQHVESFDLLFGGQAQDNDATLTSKTYAGFAQGTYKLNDDGLAVTAGLRYTREKSGKLQLASDTGRILLGEPAPAGFDYDQSRTFKNLSWQLGVQNQFSPELLVYAVTRRAYKAGGFNGNLPPRVGSAATAGDGYLDERVTDAEIGLKYANNRGPLPVRLNIALFQNWVVNSQRISYTLIGANPGSLTVTVPKGKIYGAELDASVRPASWLTLGGSFNYTNSSYSGLAVGASAIAGCDGAVVISNGSSQCYDRVPDVPKTSATIFADVIIPLDGTISATLHGDLYNQSKSFTSPRSVNTDGTVIDGYTLTNFRIGVEDKDAGWSLTANLKNAFDKVHYVGGLPTGEIYQINLLLPGDPRTFTVEARFKF